MTSYTGASGTAADLPLLGATAIEARRNALADEHDARTADRPMNDVLVQRDGDGRRHRPPRGAACWYPRCSAPAALVLAVRSAARRPKMIIATSRAGMMPSRPQMMGASVTSPMTMKTSKVASAAASRISRYADRPCASCDRRRRSASAARSAPCEPCTEGRWRALARRDSSQLGWGRRHHAITQSGADRARRHRLRVQPAGAVGGSHQWPGGRRRSRAPLPRG